MFRMDRLPTAADRVSMPPGVMIETPYGVMSADGRLQMTPEQAVAYQTATVQARRDFGPHPWAGDPNAPPPPVQPGRASFNPFTGQWSGPR